MAGEIFIADKETLDLVKSNTDIIKQDTNFIKNSCFFYNDYDVKILYKTTNSTTQEEILNVTGEGILISVCQFFPPVLGYYHNDLINSKLKINCDSDDTNITLAYLIGRYESDTGGTSNGSIMINCCFKNKLVISHNVNRSNAHSVNTIIVYGIKK